jgi:hypothetical protein
VRNYALEPFLLATLGTDKEALAPSMFWSLVLALLDWALQSD